MTVVAGVDVGNTTTEVVLVDLDDVSGPRPVAWDRAPTRGVKGSAESLHGAAVLLRRLERRAEHAASVVAMAQLRPVRTAAASVEQPAPATGRLLVVDVSGGTTGGTGTGVGRPVRVDDGPEGGGPVVVLVPAGTGYETTVGTVTGWLALGVDVRAVLLADDEAVLVAARLPVPMPVADEVDLAACAGADLVAVELRSAGHRLVDVADPIRLSALLGVPESERADAVAVAELLGDRSRAVVARTTRPADRPDLGATTGQVVLAGERRLIDVAAVAAVRAARPGTATSWLLPGWPADEAVDDLWAVDLRELAASVAARSTVASSRSLVLAGLRSSAGPDDPAALLAAELTAPVVVAGSEAVASRRGALSTPGVGSTATVVDLGGGTVDAIGPDGGEVVVAGAGEMLTVAVATLLGMPRGAADWVKRGPSSRVEEPQLVLAEDGERAFLDRRLPPATVGSLVVPGPAGYLPFGGRMAPAEWRALRLRTKERVLLDNVSRALGALDEQDAGDVLLVGGVAADDELVSLLRPLVGGRPVGRGDVAGGLGHRYAVAYGLALLATSS